MKNWRCFLASFWKSVAARGEETRRFPANSPNPSPPPPLVKLGEILLSSSVSVTSKDKPKPNHSHPDKAKGDGHATSAMVRKDSAPWKFPFLGPAAGSLGYGLSPAFSHATRAPHLLVVRVFVLFCRWLLFSLPPPHLACPRYIDVGQGETG